MQGIYRQIEVFIENHKEDMLTDLETLVNLEGHFNEKEKVEQARDWYKRQLEFEGFECHVREVSENKAGMLIGILGKEREGAPIILSGHLDTVHYSGSFDKPFYVKEGIAYGPGVLDMKGGMIIALYIVKALNFIGYDKHPIKMIVIGEEESDHVGNDTDLYITEESKGACCAFNFECGELENRLCTSRKSQYTYYFKINGVGGHAGNDFERGKNAIHEATHKINEIIQLTNMEKGTTVTTSVIKGGEHSSGIADYCEVIFDVRVKSEEEAKRIFDSMNDIATKTFIEGTTTKLDFYKAKLAPLQEDEKILDFLNFTNKIAEENGYKAFGKIHRGGATDAGNIAAAGLPVLCACGIRGDFAHNKKEYGVVESLYDRTKIFATTIARIDEMLNK